MIKDQYTDEYLRKGLSQEEVIQQRQQYGENVLTPPKSRSLWRLYLEKYQDPIIQILLFEMSTLYYKQRSFSSFFGVVGDAFNFAVTYLFHSGLCV